MNLPESGARSGGATPYRFDDIVVDPTAHALLRAGVAQPVEPKAFAVLLALLQRPGELVKHDDLLDLIWGHRHVTPGVLTRAIAQLRHALGDDPHEPRYIQTLHALGYSFVGQLQPDVGARGPPHPTTGEVGVDDPLPQAVGAPNARPADPEGHAEVATSPPSEPASTWSDAETVSALGPPIDRRHRHRAWQVAAVVAFCAWLVWAVIQRVEAPSPRVAASIAVMPFTNLSGQSGDDYFADGLTEEMRDALASVKGLKVAAPVAPMASGDAADAKAIGARLGVATILDASVRREGERVRITARLTDTASGFTLWSHTYDQQLAGVFATQSEIAAEVVRALLGVIPGESDALKKRLTPTRDEAAFDVYLQGLQLLRQTTPSASADQAIERFGEALRRDSGFAKAQAGICRAEIWRFESKHSADAFRNAQLACQRAAEMDPTLAEVDLALGDLFRASGNSERALQHYHESARSPALQVRAHIGAAQVYAGNGQRDLALKEFRQAQRLSPGDPAVLAQIGYQQFLDGDFGQAVASYREAVDLRPGDAELWGTLGALYMMVGDNAAAAKALEHSIAITPTAATLTDLGYLKYQGGDFAAAVDLQRQATSLDPTDFQIWGNLGDALRADPTASAQDVQKAFEEAAVRAEAYLKIKPDDARAVAALGLYRVRLGDQASALALVKRAESLHTQPAEVALLNAETLALLGDIRQARVRLAAARAAGVAETLINGNFTFRRLQLLPAAGSAGAGAGSPAPSTTSGRPPGG
ncbi:MAG TPA: tetratricopeptide repeat protein [Rhodanobacter sp.]